MKRNYGHTLKACYIGYFTQAINHNLSPLLFVIFQREFGLSVEQITFLISMNFGVQIIMDIIGSRYADRIGYRPCIVGAHFFSILGMVGLVFLPITMSSPFLGLALAMVFRAIGSGFLEVMLSPMVEALPGEEKAAAMSLLHSFYCWGFVGVVLLSTIYFGIFGTGNWRYLPLIWAILPFFNMLLFTQVPIRTLTEEGGGLPIRKLLTMKTFWLFFIILVCASAAEQAISQWSSLFAETGLQVSKTVGDLLGPGMFALLMGVARLIYGKNGHRMPLKPFLIGSTVFCVLSYFIAVFAPWPMLALLGCGLSGFFVGILWPGGVSLASAHMPNGGTAMFGLLALAGDVGCSVGPSLVGFVSGLANDNMKMGLLAAAIYSIALLVLLPTLKSK